LAAARLDDGVKERPMADGAHELFVDRVLLHVGQVLLWHTRKSII
jgi:hypothetical protein